MREVLKTYQLELLVKGPVFVGSGKDIGKKEYLFLDAETIGVISPEKFYQAMRRKGKSRQLEEFLLSGRKEELSNWLSRERLRVSDFKDCIRYTLKCKELVQARKDNKIGLNISECVKDPYGKPYIPGSSLKGMLRTILLGCDIIEHPGKYRGDKSQMTEDVFSNRKGSRNNFLKSNISQIEEKNYRTLMRKDSKPLDAVNDIMQGFIVSDSEPLELSDLTLCQPFELHADGKEGKLNQLRESIKPGTKIRFTLTIDETVCEYRQEDIERAIAIFADQLNQNFGRKFTEIDQMRDNQVLLGGGAGFLSKTIIYPMYGYEEGIKVTQKIFEKTGVPKEHGHRDDKKYGVSPHIMKCTRYQGKLCKMGLCEFRFV